MRPLDLQVIGKEIAIKWADQTEGFIPLETLRRRCPCAGCQGERDVMGQLHKGPEQTLTLSSFVLVRIDWVGSYAVQPIWKDGHATGLYPFEYLHALAKSLEE